LSLDHKLLVIRPTPKQIAFLNFLGYEDASTYTKEQAHDLISQLVESDDPEIELRCQRWINARFALHPKLYSHEQEMMNDTFNEPFRRFVRECITGASARLSREKISDVIESLHGENPIWWRTRDRNLVMFERLKVLHPQCCDGAAPKPRTYVPRSKPVHESVTVGPPPARGCGSVILAVFTALLAAYLFYQWM
jgi:hypothetical protein